MCLCIYLPGRRDPSLSACGNADPHSRSYLSGKLVLQRKDILQIAFITLGPTLSQLTGI